MKTLLKAALYLFLFIFLISLCIALLQQSDSSDRQTVASVADTLTISEMIKRDSIKHRKELINKQFSQWDGSHIKLEQIIKESMHDPDSYKHVETRYSDKGDHLIVITKYRGANAFGGIVTEYAKAKVTLYGKVLEVTGE